MSFDLQSTLESLQMGNYASLILIVTVVYDYFVTFLSEVEYVWSRPWTWISGIFVLLRYVGLSWAITSGLFGSTFIPSIQRVRTVLSLLVSWGYLIFLSAADLVMILRVYAMWNRAKWILYVLLSIFMAQSIVSVVLAAIYYNPNIYLPVAPVQAINSSTCRHSFQDNPLLPLFYAETPRFVLGTTLLVFAVIPTVKQAVEMYNAIREWKTNQYMELLIKDGILYFLVNAVISITSSLAISLPSTTRSTSLLFLDSFANTVLCVTMPRFIISVRELYDRDLRNSRRGTDAGFDMRRSRPNSNQLPVAVESMSIVTSKGDPLDDIAFHDPTEGSTGESEGTRVEGWGGEVDQV